MFGHLLSGPAAVAVPMFMIVGNKGGSGAQTYGMTSVDAGLTWLNMTLTKPTTGELKAVATDGAGTWCILIEDGYTGISTDAGATWVWTAPPAGAPTSGWVRLFYGGSSGNERFLAVGESLSKPFMWSTTGAGGTWNTVSFLPGVLMAVGHDPGASGTVMRSVDAGLTWEVLDFGEDHGSARSVAYGADVWCVLFDNGYIGNSSDNGDTWTFHQPAGIDGSNWQMVRYGGSPGNKRFVAIGPVGGADKPIMWSTTGLVGTWNPVTFVPGTSIHSITPGDNGHWVITGYRYKCFLSVDDALSWTDQGDIFQTEPINGIWDGEQFVFPCPALDGSSITDFEVFYSATGLAGDWASSVTVCKNCATPVKGPGGIALVNAAKQAGCVPTPRIVSASNGSGPWSDPGVVVNCLGWGRGTYGGGAYIFINTHDPAANQQILRATNPAGPWSYIDAPNAAWQFYDISYNGGMVNDIMRMAEFGTDRWVALDRSGHAYVSLDEALTWADQGDQGWANPHNCIFDGTYFVVPTDAEATGFKVFYSTTGLAASWGYAETVCKHPWGLAMGDFGLALINDNDTRRVVRSDNGAGPWSSPGVTAIPVLTWDRMAFGAGAYITYNQSPTAKQPGIEQILRATDPAGTWTQIAASDNDLLLNDIAFG